MSQQSNSLSQLALQKFKKDFWGVFSLGFIVFVGIISTFAYVIAPDSSEYANQMHLSIHSKKPGFSVQMLTIPQKTEIEESIFSNLFFGKKIQDSEIPITAYSINENTLTYTEYASDGLEGMTKSIDMNGLLESELISNKTFLFGTDKYGRDLLSRTLVGARISFFIGFIAVLISLVIGIFMGSVAGYFGGRVDLGLYQPYY